MIYKNICYCCNTHIALYHIATCYKYSLLSLVMPVTVFANSDPLGTEVKNVVFVHAIRAC